MGCGRLGSGATLRDLLVGGPCDRKYISLFGGWNALHNYDGNRGPALNVSGSFNDGWAIGGAVGREIGNSFRGEFEFAFRDNTGDDWMINQVSGDWSGHANVYSGMSNLYYDLDCGSLFKPYIGGGIGFAVVDAELTTPITRIDVSDTAFAYQAIVGVTKSLSNRADAFIEYRNFGFNEVDVVNRGGGFNFQGENFEAENLFVGLRFYR